MCLRENMKITVLNGTPTNGFAEFEQKLIHYIEKLKQDHHVVAIDIEKQNLAFCNGCFNCWWKIPGECNIKDDMHFVSKKMMWADRLIFASPLIHSFPSALLKKVQDRMLPLLLPYIKLIDGECHHEERYENYPEIELYFGTENETNKEDHHIVNDLYKRFAINFYSKIVKTQYV
jgi:multimeric flavodoxin WrbA